MLPSLSQLQSRLLSQLQSQSLSQLQSQLLSQLQSQPLSQRLSRSLSQSLRSSSSSQYRRQTPRNHCQSQWRRLLLVRQYASEVLEDPLHAAGHSDRRGVQALAGLTAVRQPGDQLQPTVEQIGRIGSELIRFSATIPTSRLT